MIGLPAAIGVAAAISAATPATAAVGDGDPGLRSLCGELADDPPQGGAVLRTDPPAGAPLRAGQTVTVTLQWDEAEFGGPDLDQAAHCVVTLDGRLRLDLSAAESPSPNDGEYRSSFVVPADLTPGDCLCVLSVASGEGPAGEPLDLGGDSCLTVTAPAPTGPPAAPLPIPSRAPADALPSTPAAAPAPGPPPTEVMPLPLDELPKTGPPETRLLLAVAGLALVFGGGGIATRR